MTAKGVELRRLLRLAYNEGEADALAYADKHSTRASARMLEAEADACFETWLIQIDLREFLK